MRSNDPPLPSRHAPVAASPMRLVSALREGGPMTAAELAARLGIGAVAVRAQLRPLTASGLVERTIERRPIGRPVARFGLAPNADSLFPKRYELFARRLLEAVTAEWGPEAVDRIFQRWQDDLSATLDATLPAEAGARLEGLVAHQNEAGFMASVRSDESGVSLIERNCPVLALAARHPEICRHEAALFGRTLRWKTALVSCQATGDPVCVFRIGRAPARSGGTRPPVTPDGKE